MSRQHNFFVLQIAGVYPAEDLRTSTLLQRAQELYACALGRCLTGKKQHGRACFMGFVTFEDALHAYFALNNTWHSPWNSSTPIQLSCALALDVENWFGPSETFENLEASPKDFIWLDDYRKTRGDRPNLLAKSPAIAALSLSLELNKNASSSSSTPATTEGNRPTPPPRTTSVSPIAAADVTLPNTADIVPKPNPPGAVGSDGARLATDTVGLIGLPSEHLLGQLQAADRPTSGTERAGAGESERDSVAEAERCSTEPGRGANEGSLEQETNGRTASRQEASAEDVEMTEVGAAADDETSGPAHESVMGEVGSALDGQTLETGLEVKAVVHTQHSVDPTRSTGPPVQASAKPHQDAGSGFAGDYVKGELSSASAQATNPDSEVLSPGESGPTAAGGGEAILSVAASQLGETASESLAEPVAASGTTSLSIRGCASVHGRDQDNSPRQSFDAPSSPGSPRTSRPRRSFCNDRRSDVPDYQNQRYDDRERDSRTATKISSRTSRRSRSPQESSRSRPARRNERSPRRSSRRSRSRSPTSRRRESSRSRYDRTDRDSRREQDNYTQDSTRGGRERDFSGYDDRDWRRSRRDDSTRDLHDEHDRHRHIPTRASAHYSRDEEAPQRDIGARDARTARERDARPSSRDGNGSQSGAREADDHRRAAADRPVRERYDRPANPGRTRFNSPVPPRSDALDQESTAYHRFLQELEGLYGRGGFEHKVWRTDTGVEVNATSQNVYFDKSLHFENILMHGVPSHALQLGPAPHRDKVGSLGAVDLLLTVTDLKPKDIRAVWLCPNNVNSLSVFIACRRLDVFRLNCRLPYGSGFPSNPREVTLAVTDALLRLQSSAKQARDGNCSDRVLEMQ